MAKTNHNESCSICQGCFACSPRSWAGHLDCETASGKLEVNNELFLQFKLRPGFYRPLLCQFAGNA